MIAYEKLAKAIVEVDRMLAQGWIDISDDGFNSESWEAVKTVVEAAKTEAEFRSCDP